MSSCNTNLVSFLIERNPQTLADLTRIGEQYFAAHSTTKVQKEIPFQAFACEGGSEIAEDDIDAYVAQSISRSKPQETAGFSPGSILQ